MFQKTTALQKIRNLTKRIRAIPGGTSAGKTIAVLMDLIDQAQTDVTPTLTSIVSESFPHLKRGSMRDFLNIMEAHEYYDDKRWNRTDFLYTFESGSKIEFFSADQPDKVRGPRRQRLFINEVNNVPFVTFEQLEVRTSEFIMLDWNPVAEFWYYDQIKDVRKDYEELTLTYKDNEALPQSIVDSIESRRHRTGWWKVYGLGELGEVEGKIYKNWRVLDEDEIPRGARLERYGLDFGYTNDPTALVAIYYLNGEYIIDELLFVKEMANKRIADFILDQPEPQVIVVADSAEPKSIDEIKSYGVNIVAAEKGKDSVCQGIQMVQDQRMAMTKRSTNVIKEYRNYLWETDKQGIILNKPEHEFSHSADAARYAMTSILRKPKRMTGASPLSTGVYMKPSTPSLWDDIVEGKTGGPQGRKYAPASPLK